MNPGLYLHRSPSWQPPRCGILGLQRSVVNVGDPEGARSTPGKVRVFGLDSDQRFAAPSDTSDELSSRWEYPNS